MDHRADPKWNHFHPAIPMVSVLSNPDQADTEAGSRNSPDPQLHPTPSTHSHANGGQQSHGRCRSQHHKDTERRAQRQQPEPTVTCLSAPLPHPTVPNLTSGNTARLGRAHGFTRHPALLSSATTKRSSAGRHRTTRTSVVTPAARGATRRCYAGKDGTQHPPEVSRQRGRSAAPGCAQPGWRRLSRVGPLSAGAGRVIQTSHLRAALREAQRGTRSP